MIEKQLTFTTASSTKLIEKILEDDHAAINHMILPKGDSLPEHYSNSNVYMIVTQGTITIQLSEQPNHEYPSGSIICIPYNTKMNASNQHDEILEFFVVKAPSPKTMMKSK
jgi:quercetin dioxygenase-like cupin family protein